MKVKLDENIPVSLAEALVSLGHDVQTVIGQGLTGRADAVAFRVHVELEYLPSASIGQMRCLNRHGCRDFFGRGSGRLVHLGRQRQGVTRNMSQDPGAYRRPNLSFLLLLDQQSFAPGIRESV